MNQDLQTTAPNPRYTQLRELGRGPGTVVDLVYDEVRQGELACKRWVSLSAETRFRLRQQYRRALAVTHPNLVRLFELFTEGDATCLTLEAITGVDVRAHVQAFSTPSSLALVLHLLQQLSDALTTLHMSGIVHRDVKPSNLLVESNGRLVLLDGGFVWPRESHFEPLDELTLSGTLAYLAPETLRGALPSVEADWYSFGVLAAELILGRPAFSGSIDTMLRAKDAEQRSLRSERGDVPIALDDLVCGLLDRDWRVRPTPAQLQFELRELCLAHPFSDVTLDDVTETPPSAAGVELPGAGTTPRAFEVALDSVELDLALARLEVGQLDDSPATFEPQIERADPSGARLVVSERAPALLSEIRSLAPHIENEQSADTTSRAMRNLETEQAEPIELVQWPRIEVMPSELEQAIALGPTLSIEEQVRPLQLETVALAELPGVDLAVALRDATGQVDPAEIERAVAAKELDVALADVASTRLSGVVLQDERLEAAEPLSADSEAAEPVAEDPPSPASPPLAATPSVPERTVELVQLQAWLANAPGPRLALIRGAANSGKSQVVRGLATRARLRAESLVFEVRCTPSPDRAYTGFSEIITQLVAQLPACSARVTEAIAAAQQSRSLLRMFPALEEHAVPARESEAVDPQRRFIDALLAFRRLWLQVAASTQVVLCFDDVQTIDRDAVRLMSALLNDEPRVDLTLVLSYRSSPELPDWLAAQVERWTGDCGARCIQLDLQTQRGSAAVSGESGADTGVFTRTSTAAVALVHSAELATSELALELANERYRLALGCAADPAAFLEDAARAALAAGALDEAAERWLALARSSPDRPKAQRCELEAAAALLHAGHEQEGRALLETVLRSCGMRWPRAPWLTSTFERARVLFGQPRAADTTTESGAASDGPRRFDALWAAAKEVVLLTPTAGDALSVRALREATLLGDPSRLSWALGYEAALEANIGGQYMHKRARSLQARVTELAGRTGHALDVAYARSVEGVVAWFAGEWATAERTLRDALQLYARTPNVNAYERHVLESFLVGALEAQGKLHELSDLLGELRIAVQQTGHVHAAAMCSLAETSLPALASDKPLPAIARADAAISGIGNDDFTPLRFQHCVVTVSARLYAGHAAQAFQQIEQLWQRPSRAYFLRLDAVGVMLRQLRGRAALAMAVRSPAAEAERLRKLAAREAAAIGSSGTLYARALEHVIDCGVANLSGRHALAKRHTQEASDAFDRAGMHLMREIACYHQAQQIKDKKQRAAALAQSHAYFARANIQNPTALVNAWFPVSASQK